MVGILKKKNKKINKGLTNSAPYGIIIIVNEKRGNKNGKETK